MPVSRLANTWKCLNLFYSYYFRGMHFLFAFSLKKKKKASHVFLKLFCNGFEVGRYGLFFA